MSEAPELEARPPVTVERIATSMVVMLGGTALDVPEIAASRGRHCELTLDEPAVYRGRQANRVAGHRRCAIRYDARMGYAEMKECWLDLKGADASALAELLPVHADVLGLAGTPGSIGVGAGKPHTLITYCSDGDAIVALTLLPSDAIVPELAAALAAIDGRVFAGSADLDPVTWDAAARVLALLAAEHLTVEQLADA
jgi:hypothetical protein